MRSHKVLAAKIVLDASVSYMVVPKVKQMSFMVCDAKNTGLHTLLPGEVSIYLDNRFLSRFSIKENIPPQASLSFPIGPDPYVHVAYTQSESKLTGLQHSSVSCTRITSLITIRNTRRIQIEGVVVRDSIPRSGDNDIKVELFEPKELAYDHAVDGESVKLQEGVIARWTKTVDWAGGESDGMMEWVCDLEAGGVTELKLVFDVTTPPGMPWHIASMA